MSQLIIDIKSAWRDLAAKYSQDDQLIVILYNELVDHYTEAHRYYHNLDHLKFLLDIFYKHKKLLAEPDTVLFSIFYHDVIYNPGTSDNERQSAILARRALDQLKVPLKKAEEIASYILATAEHRVPSEAGNDLKFFIDFDLAILAAPSEEYKTYLFNIKMEFAHLPLEQFIAGRKAFIGDMLGQPTIFYTDSFQSMEEVARKNMQWELEMGSCLFSAR